MNEKIRLHNPHPRDLTIHVPARGVCVVPARGWYPSRENPPMGAEEIEGVDQIQGLRMTGALNVEKE